MIDRAAAGDDILTEDDLLGLDARRLAGLVLGCINVPHGTEIVVDEERLTKLFAHAIEASRWRGQAQCLIDLSNGVRDWIAIINEPHAEAPKKLTKEEKASAAVAKEARGLLRSVIGQIFHPYSDIMKRTRPKYI